VRGLYGLATESGETDNRVEREYMGPDVDEPASLVHKMMLGLPRALPTPVQRRDWSRFLVSLLMRNPKMVANLRRRGTQIAKDTLAANHEEYEQVREESDPATLLDWVAANTPLTTENFPIATMPALIESDLLNDATLRAEWSVFDIPSPNHELVIGEDPLAYVGTMDTSFLLALPLAPRCAFVAFSNPLTGARIRAITPDRMARNLNEWQVARTLRYVYATDASTARFVELRLKPNG